jgi:hypothetical protein
MTISVQNTCEGSIEVAINLWGETGHTKFYTIESGNSEYWDRSDGRGFIMRVKTLGSAGVDAPYYVYADSNVVVTDSSVGNHQWVTDGGRQLNTAGAGGEL